MYYPDGANRPNILQRISGLVASQLTNLQSIMHISMTTNIHNQQHYNDNPIHSPPTHLSPQNPANRQQSLDWICHKCSFANYQWRDKCLKCHDSKPLKGFVPGPEDWKCTRCHNINYARRLQCNRCKTPK